MVITVETLWRRSRPRFQIRIDAIVQASPGPSHDAINDIGHPIHWLESLSAPVLIAA